jgi:hypothetical protein
MPPEPPRGGVGARLARHGRVQPSREHFAGALPRGVVRFLHGPGAEGRLRVVLDHELQRARLVLPRLQRGERQGRVDPGRDTGGGDDLAVDDDAVGDRLGAEGAQGVS